MKPFIEQKERGLPFERGAVEGSGDLLLPQSLALDQSGKGPVDRGSVPQDAEEARKTEVNHRQ